ncbi:DNA repair protein RadA [Patescibacteria group bacterium]|nr:DNA repair protein RadA [Patescibacteria group bacterium]
MAKQKETIFVCSNCGNEFFKWSGNCSGCGEWNSLREVKNLGGGKNKRGRRQTKKGLTEVVNLAKLNLDKSKNDVIFSSNIPEFDRVLGKGIVRGSVVLFSGEPGVGKSTLLTQLVGKIGGLYVAGEESVAQIRLRVKRLALDEKNFDILATNSIEEIEETLARVKNVYKIMVVDSIQVMVTSDVVGVPGAMSQLRGSTFKLVEMAKKLGVAIFIVGHVTKEGNIAGPKLLEHMVDTVMYFEGEKRGNLRILRVNKNRFGSTDEVGVFSMGEKGLRQIRSDEINLVSKEGGGPGQVVTVVIEGGRPMMVEVQALVTESYATIPRRGFVGIDHNRGQMLVAIAQKGLNLPLYKCDVFVSVMGGIRVTDTGVDLAVIGAIVSSYKNKEIEKGSVLVGEVSLVGEVRQVSGMEKREKEAKGLGRKMLAIKNIRELG